MVSGALGMVAFAGVEVSVLLCIFLFTRHGFRLVIPLTQETLPCLEVSSPSVTLYFTKATIAQPGTLSKDRLQRQAVCTVSSPEKGALSLVEFAHSSRANSVEKGSLGPVSWLVGQ